MTWARKSGHSTPITFFWLQMNLDPDSFNKRRLKSWPLGQRSVKVTLDEENVALILENTTCCRDPLYHHRPVRVASSSHALEMLLGCPQHPLLHSSPFFSPYPVSWAGYLLTKSTVFSLGQNGQAWPPFAYCYHPSFTAWGIIKNGHAPAPNLLFPFLTCGEIET